MPDTTGFVNMGGSPYTTGFAGEGLDRSQDSLTQALRSLTNLLGMGGPQDVAEGRQASRTGQNILTSGLPVMRQALQGLAAPSQYYQNLLSGDRAAMEQAVAPETSSILDQYRGKRSQMAKLGPRSGGTGEAVAGSQFGQAADVAKVLQGVRPQAAQGAQQVAGAQAGIGRDVAGVGGAMAQLGLSEQGMGIGQLTSALQGLLGRRGQNIQETGQTMQMVGEIGKALGSIIAARIAK